MEQINKQTFQQKLKSYRKSPLSLTLFLLVTISALVTAFVLFFLIAYILIKGVPHLTLDLFSWTYNSENVSMLPSIVNTFLMTLLSLLIATPLGIFSAIYLVEYAKRGSKVVKIGPHYSGKRFPVYLLSFMVYSECCFLLSRCTGAILFYQVRLRWRL